MTTSSEPAVRGSTPLRRPLALDYLVRAQQVLFVGLLVLGAAQAVADGTHRVLVITLAALVLAWYGYGIVLAHSPASQTRAVGWLVVLTAGWLALVVSSATFVWVVFALFFLYLQLLELGWAIPCVAALTGVTITALGLHNQSLQVGGVIGPAIGAAVAVVITIVYRDLSRESERRAQLVAELTAAQQQLAAAERHAGTLAERERLAHEIHDTVAQGLASIVLLLRSVVAQADPLPKTAQRQLDASVAAARGALEDTRRLVRALTPAELAGQPLASALRRLVADVGPVGIEVDFDVDGDPYELPVRTAVALLRTAQGALGNVIAHSMAERARITLTFLADVVSLDIVDDGRGFDLLVRAAQTAEGTGIGLAAMRTRLAEVGGTLTVESAPGEGTAIGASVPTVLAEVIDA